jgi:hypothetical protein
MGARHCRAVSGLPPVPGPAILTIFPGGGAAGTDERMLARARAAGHCWKTGTVTSGANRLAPTGIVGTLSVQIP